MIPEKIQSFRKILERNNLITVLCLLLVLVSFILNYLERRETLGKQLEFSYYVATDGEVIPARYAQRRDNIEIEIRHHLAMFVDDWYALTQDTWEAKAEAAGWLGGNSIRDMYIARREAGFFNRFIQGNIRYEAKIADQGHVELLLWEMSQGRASSYRHCPKHARMMMRLRRQSAGGAARAAQMLRHLAG